MDSDPTIEHLQKIQLELNVFIEKSFNNLSNQIRDSLQERGCNPTEILSCLQGYDMIPKLLASEEKIFLEDKEKLPDYRTIRDVWTCIGKYFTSYSYKILEAIIENLGTERDKQSLQEYEKKFSEHSKRSIEVYSEALARFTEGTTFTKLIVKINRSFKKISSQHLDEFKANLAKALDILDEDHLLRFIVKPGCIEITYHVPLYIECQLKAFPISAEQKSQLRSLKVMWLKCGSFWLYLEVCMNVIAFVHVHTSLHSRILLLYGVCTDTHIINRPIKYSIKKDLLTWCLLEYMLMQAFGSG